MKNNIFKDIENQPNEKLEQLKQLLPNVFDQDGNLIESELKQFVSQNYEKPDFETFQFNWAGKTKAKQNATAYYTDGTLEPDTARSKNFENTQNLIIEGDNLQVLHLLKKSYKGKVKCIYIDPPYNTGNDFVYKDKFELDIKEYLKATGEIDEETEEPLTEDIKKDNGKKHSKWLSFMYPRLCLARELLREDGVIFISIDDNEVAHLRILMNEIFGEEETIAEFVWKRRVSSGLAINNISTDHEYVLLYSKNNAILNGIDKDFKHYSNPDNDPRGDWISDNLTVGMNASMRPNQAYTLIDPNTGIEYLHNPNRVWAYIPSTMNKLIEEGRIIFPADKNRRPMLKRFKNELKATYNPSSTWLDRVGMNTEATRSIQEIMDANIFEFSKPLSLIKYISQCPSLR